MVFPIIHRLSHFNRDLRIKCIRSCAREPRNCCSHCRSFACSGKEYIDAYLADEISQARSGQRLIFAANPFSSPHAQIRVHPAADLSPKQTLLRATDRLSLIAVRISPNLSSRLQRSGCQPTVDSSPKGSLSTGGTHLGGLLPINTTSCETSHSDGVASTC